MPMTEPLPLTRELADRLYAGIVHTHVKADITNLETITLTPTSGAIPKANGSGVIALGWIPNGSGSGLNADLLDGLDSSAFSLAGHTHTHSSLSGLTSGDDHTQYTVITPGSSSRNVLKGSGDYTPLTLRRNGSGSVAPLLIFGDESSGSLSAFKADGAWEYSTIDGDPSITKMIYGAKTYTPTGSEIYQGARFRPTLNPSTNTTASGYGGVFAPRYTGSGNVSEMYGLQGSVSQAGTGTVTSSYGLFFSVGGSNTGNITTIYGAKVLVAQQAGSVGSTWGTVYGVHSEIDATGATAGAITNARLLYGNAQVSGSGAITNLYGLYLENMTAGATLNYAIFTGLGKVQFGDNVVITGNRTYTSWTTSGKGLDVQAATLTDSSGSGTIALRAVNSFGVPTLAASSSETLTLSANLYIAGAPVASTNVTQTTPVSLLIDTGAAASKGIIIRAAASPSVNTFEIQSSAGGVLNSVSGVGIVTVDPTDAGTNTVTNALIVGHNTSGTPAANYGTGISLLGQSSTTVDTAMGRLRAFWATATHASRKASVILSVFDTAERDALTISTDGTNPTTTIIGANAGTGLTLTGTGIGLDNGQRLWWKNSGGTYVTVFVVDGSNNAALRNPGGSLIFQSSGALALMSITDAGVVTVRNQIATTGVTQFIVHAGAGQSSTDLMSIRLADSSVVGSIGATGLATFQLKDAATNAVVNTLTAGHQTSGTPAAGYGTGFNIQGHSSNNTLRDMARLRSLWTTATDGSRATRSVISGFDTAERDVIGWGANGSAGLLGFHDKAGAPIAQAVLATGAGRTVDDVITALQNLGLVKQS